MVCEARNSATKVQVLAALLLLSISSLASSGVRAADPEWWSPEWLTKSPYSPSFEVRDTVNKYGRYADKTKRITLGDLIKLHGHFCGGLVEGAGALKLAFDKLFPGGVVDRTDLRIASNAGRSATSARASTPNRCRPP